MRSITIFSTLFFGLIHASCMEAGVDSPELVVKDIDPCESHPPWPIYENPNWKNDLDVTLVPFPEQAEALKFLNGDNLKQVEDTKYYWVEDRLGASKKYFVRICLSGFFNKYAGVGEERYIKGQKIFWSYDVNNGVISTIQQAMVQGDSMKPVAYIVWTDFEISAVHNTYHFVH